MVHSQKTITFVEKASKKHGGKYSYDNVNYINNYTKISITCKKHGPFEQTPNKHLNGRGCRKCGGTCPYTTKSFIVEAIKKHGITYSYEKVNYTNSKEKIIITCKKHGPFEQTPNGHLQGQGCPKCAGTYPYTTDSFITEAIKIHGNTYTYEKVNYINASAKIIITCKIHGEFEQVPSGHLQGNGCNKCSYERRGLLRSSNTEIFIADAIKKHDNTYSYDNVNYINAYTKISITCKKHGEFEQVPGNHLYGAGCSKCAGTYPYTTESFIAEAIKIHGNTYTYEKVNYTNNRTKISITCKTHGDFEQKPNGHLSGQGCRKCSGSYPHTTESFVTEAIKKHRDKYSYNNVNYINNHTKISITCKNHGDFEQIPNNHLNGAGCPSCVNKTEHKLYNTLSSVYNDVVQQFTAEWCTNKRMLPFDFCIPEYKIIIELDGAQHFRQVANWQSCEETVERDRYKSDCANENNYSVIRLLQKDVWNDNYNWTWELHNVIKKIRASTTVMNIYLCKNDEYADHTAL
jgi:very-short-patch-repair endonuclease